MSTPRELLTSDASQFEYSILAGFFGLIIVSVLTAASHSLEGYFEPTHPHAAAIAP